MNFTSIKTAFNKAGFVLQKNSPEILVVTGVVGATVAAIMACRETLKVADVMDSAKKNMDYVHELKDEEAPEYKKELLKTCTTISLDFAKLYGPSVALGAASIGCIFASHGIMTKRNMALASAYTAVDSAFKTYRKNVVDRFGADVDRDMAYGVSHEQITEDEVDENGKKKKVKKNIDIKTGIELATPYAVVFDNRSRNYERSEDLRRFFLKQVEGYTNQKLISQGHVFLNEVYDQLDLPRTEAGQIVGWYYDPKNGSGDNFVDFNIQELHKRNDTMPELIEEFTVIDFNVDGNILSKI